MNITDEMLHTYVAASNEAYRHPDGPEGEIRAGLAAVAPLIAAQALRSGADLVERQCPEPVEHAGNHCDYRHAAAMLRMTAQIAVEDESTT